jgi:O-antigen ligase
MLKTGSRANFVTFIVLFAVIFILVPRGTKALLALGAPIAMLIVFLVLPRTTLNRMLAIVLTSSEEEVAMRTMETQDDQLRGAIGSQAARMELQKLAVSATLRHPLFGVGPLMFENETADNILKSTGKKAPWQTAHNSYLKISSENGIVGFIFYVWVLVAAFRLTYRCYKRTEGNPALKMANGNSVAILLALVVYACGSFFCDIVYLSYLPITVGLAAANYLAVMGDDRQSGGNRSVFQPFAAPIPAKS